MNENISSKVSQILLDIHAVTFRFNPPFTYTSGIKSPIYLDNRVIMSYPKEREEIISYYVEVIKEKIGLDNVDYISATATAAIPQGAWIAQQLNLPMVFCRPAKKGHGKENQIEGSFKKRAQAVIVEDHISTGGSALVNASALRSLGGEVKFVLATTTYETERSKEALRREGLTLFTLTTGKNIVSQAFEQNVLTSEQKTMVDDWFDDPVGWSRKHGFE